MTDQPKRAGLELWPALLPLWPGHRGWDCDPPASGVFTLGGNGGAEDEPWVAAVTPNPMLDAPSRGRLMWLMATAPSLWESLRWALANLTAEAAGSDQYANAVRVLVDAGGFVPTADNRWLEFAIDVRRGVNDDTLDRLQGCPPPAAGWTSHDRLTGKGDDRDADAQP